MIARVTGRLVRVTDDTALVQCNGLCYEILIPAANVGPLLALLDEDVTLHTLHYLEGGLGGGNPIPRLAGFLTEIEREFAQRFVTVKGMGMKAVLKAWAMPVDAIANAIERKDTQALSKLPGIGKRTAEKIVAELNGKVGKFALFRTGEREATPVPEASGFEMEVIGVLEQLGFSSSEAGQMAAPVLENGAYHDVEAAIQEIFRRQGAEA